MTITPASSSEDTYYSATAISRRTISVDIGSRTNGLLVVGVSSFDSGPSSTPDISSMTYAGADLWKASEALRTNGNNDYLSELWYLANPANGTNDLVINFASNNIRVLHVTISWWDGAHQTQSEVLATSGNGTGTTDPSVGVNPPVDDCLIVSQYMSEANDVLSVGSGETLLQDHDFGPQVAGSSYAIQTTATAQTIDFSGTDSDWAMAVGVFKPASGANEYTQSISGALSSGGVIARNTARLLSATLSGGGTLIRQFGRAITGGLTTVGSLTRHVMRLFDGVIALSGVVAQYAGKVLAGVVTTSGATTRHVGRVFSGAITGAGVVLKHSPRNVAGEIMPSGGLATIKTKLMALVGALSPSSVLNRITATAKIGAVSPDGIAVKITGRSLVGSISAEATLAAVKAILRSLSGAIGPNGILALSIEKTVSGLLAPSGLVGRLVGKVIAGAANLAGALLSVKARLYSIAGALSFSGQANRRTGKVTGGVVMFSSSVIRGIGRRVSGILSAAGVAVGLLLNITILTPNSRIYRVPLEIRVCSIVTEQRVFSPSLDHRVLEA